MDQITEEHLLERLKPPFLKMLFPLLQCLVHANELHSLPGGAFYLNILILKVRKIGAVDMAQW